MNKARVLFFVCTLFVMNSLVAVGVVLANDPPTITCPDPQDPAVLCNHSLIDGGDGVFNLGDLVEGTAVGFDPDSDPLSFGVVSITRDAEPGAPVNAPVIDANGNFSWQSTGSDLEGMWQFCLETSDGEFADTCCLEVELFLKFYLSIRDETGTVDTIPSYAGQDRCVSVNLSPAVPLSALKVQVSFNELALWFLGSATPVNNLLGWEYFNYRLLSNTTCAGSEPLGLISIEAIADLDNGPSAVPPECSFALDGNIIRLCFTVTQDWNYLGQCLPVGFCSIDCGDNLLVSIDGSVEYLPLGTDPGCLTGPVVENIQLCWGGICVRDPDPSCDINLNGIEPEIGDVTLFINYFLYGDAVLHEVWYAVQKQAMDCNNDGVTATLADLAYMIAIITGTISPFPSGAGTPADIVAKTDRDQVTVSTASAADIGGALFTFRYSGVDIGEPVLAHPVPGMVVKSHAADGELRVLLIPPMTKPGGRIVAGHNDILEIPIKGDGIFELTKVDLSDASGEVLPGRILSADALPTSYALLQNYPNPFNAGTVIPFDLRDASEWELTIYNIVGQGVRTFSGVSGASRVEVEWDGTNRTGQPVASGMYFYRISAGKFVASRKMTLLK